MLPAVAEHPGAAAAEVAPGGQAGSVLARSLRGRKRLFRGGDGVDFAMPTSFRPYAPDQSLLLPPSPRDWLPEG
ncbi:MAG TPA: hypothetical protein VOA80_10230, partial [Thermoanaerobaculia bacterium]|nr:hypothetical protein [Thermoanaerobaculia bacterium]